MATPKKKFSSKRITDTFRFTAQTSPREVKELANQIFLEIAYDMGVSDPHDEGCEDALADRLSDYNVPLDIIENVLKDL